MPSVSEKGLDAFLDELAQYKDYHNVGYYGNGETVCVLDSGTSSSLAPFFYYPITAYDFTADHSVEDFLEHGVSTLSILGSLHSKCDGVIPHARLVSLKVVDRSERIFTASLLKAFDMVPSLSCSVVVLSIGGRDMNETSIVQAIQHLESLDIIIIAAAGNDGPSQGSVLSPADHPAVWSVGALRDNHQLLMASSRGYRSHLMQRPVPEFWMNGYQVPVLSAKGECHKVSGTSIAAPLLAGWVVLMKQKEKTISPGALRCRLHQSCVFPNEIQIPSDDYPYYRNAISKQSRMIHISVMVYSRYRNELVHITNPCSWVQIDHRKLTIYVNELIVHIIPSQLHKDSQCKIEINNDTLTLSVKIETRNLPVLAWKETKDGNSISSNGDSAFTNYYSLYKTLTKSFIVNVVPYDFVVHDSLQLCFEPCSGSALFIAGVQTARTAMIQQHLRRIGIVTMLHGSACSVRYQQQLLQRITHYLSVIRFPTSWKVLYSLRNDKQEDVCIVLKQSDGEIIGLFGIGMVVDDMQLFNSIGQRIVAEMLRKTASEVWRKENMNNIALASDELYFV